jgi:hypothetical protein
MGRIAIVVLVLALAGALASFIIGAVHYSRAVRELDGSVNWALVAVWPFARSRLASATPETMARVNKAQIALIVCLTFAAATVSLSTNLNRVSK